MDSMGKWRELGYRHLVWELLRYYLSFKTIARQRDWLEELEESKSLPAGNARFPIAYETIELLRSYIRERDRALTILLSQLRDEKRAKQFCIENAIEFTTTATKNKDHHQASKSLVATVSAIAYEECTKRGIELDQNPQRRCIWCSTNGLHVTARNLDGAIPSTLNPKIIWEIKEYWGKTNGGSKMSDAVYECNLVGRELRDFETQTNISVIHAVFVDGKDQWATRKSDLNRLIDLTYQGLIDHLYVGTDVETKWRAALAALLDS